MHRRTGVYAELRILMLLYDVDEANAKPVTWRRSSPSDRLHHSSVVRASRSSNWFYIFSRESRKWLGFAWPNKERTLYLSVYISDLLINKVPRVARSTSDRGHDCSPKKNPHEADRLE